MTKPKKPEEASPATSEALPPYPSEDFRLLEQAIKKVKPPLSQEELQRVAEKAAEAEEAQNEFWRSLVRDGGLSINKTPEDGNKR